MMPPEEKPGPWRKIESALGSSPEVTRTTESGLVSPAVESTEPPVAAELLQPCPVAPVLPHGQAVVVDPSPKQNAGPGTGLTWIVPFMFIEKWIWQL